MLHAWYHARPDKPLKGRQSRHYYDLVKLFEAGIGGRLALGEDPQAVQFAKQHVLGPGVCQFHDGVR